MFLENQNYRSFLSEEIYIIFVNKTEKLPDLDQKDIFSKKYYNIIKRSEATPAINIFNISDIR